LGDARHRYKPVAKLVKALLVAALIIPLGAACTERGASSPQEAATRYLAAARSADVGGIVALAPADFDADAEARTKVAAYALVRDRTIEINYRTNDITPNDLGVDFVASGIGFKDSVRVQHLGSRWYVMIGRSRSTPAQPTAEATR
jgi:hypothetical protein